MIDRSAQEFLRDLDRTLWAAAELEDGKLGARASSPALPSRVVRKNAAEDGRAPSHQDIPGLCKSATLAEIASHGHVLTPVRYVGAEEVEGDGEPFEEKMARLVAELNGQYAKSARLEKAIKANLGGPGYE